MKKMFHFPLFFLNRIEIFPDLCYNTNNVGKGDNYLWGACLLLKELTDREKLHR